jgi:hypothetical protein
MYKKSTIPKIGTKDMREKMGEILDCVNLRGDEFIIERKHKALAALIPVRKLEAIYYAAKKFFFDFLEQQQSTLTEEELDALVSEAIAETRKKKKQ